MRWLLLSIVVYGIQAGQEGYQTGRESSYEVEKIYGDANRLRAQEALAGETPTHSYGKEVNPESGKTSSGAVDGRASSYETNSQQSSSKASESVSYFKVPPNAPPRAAQKGSPPSHAPPPPPPSLPSPGVQEKYPSAGYEKPQPNTTEGGLKPPSAANAPAYPVDVHSPSPSEADKALAAETDPAQVANYQIPDGVEQKNASEDSQKYHDTEDQKPSVTEDAGTADAEPPKDSDVPSEPVAEGSAEGAGYPRSDSKGDVAEGSGHPTVENDSKEGQNYEEAKKEEGAKEAESQSPTQAAPQEGQNYAEAKKDGGSSASGDAAAGQSDGSYKGPAEGAGYKGTENASVGEEKAAEMAGEKANKYGTKEAEYSNVAADGSASKEVSETKEPLATEPYSENSKKVDTEKYQQNASDGTETVRNEEKGPENDANASGPSSYRGSETGTYTSKTAEVAESSGSAPKNELLKVDEYPKSDGGVNSDQTTSDSYKVSVKSNTKAKVTKGGKAGRKKSRARGPLVKVDSVSKDHDIVIAYTPNGSHKRPYLTGESQKSKKGYATGPKSIYQKALSLKARDPSAKSVEPKMSDLVRTSLEKMSAPPSASNRSSESTVDFAPRKMWHRNHQNELTKSGKTSKGHNHNGKHRFDRFKSKEPFVDNSPQLTGEISDGTASSVAKHEESIGQDRFIDSDFPRPRELTRFSSSPDSPRVAVKSAFPRLPLKKKSKTSEKLASSEVASSRFPSPKRLPTERYTGDFPSVTSLKNRNPLGNVAKYEREGSKTESRLPSSEETPLPIPGSLPETLPDSEPHLKSSGNFPKPESTLDKEPSLEGTNAENTGATLVVTPPREKIPSPKTLPEEHFPGDFPDGSPLSSSKELSSKSTDASSSESFSPDIPSPKRLPEEHFSGDFPERSSLPQSGSSSLGIPTPKRLPIERYSGDFPKVYPLSQSEKSPLKSTDAATSGSAPREDIPSPKRLPEEHFQGDFPERSSLPQSGELSSKSTDASSFESFPPDIPSPKRLPEEHFSGDFPERSSLSHSGSSPLDIPSPKRLPIERFPGDFPKVYPLSQAGKLPLKRTSAVTSGSTSQEEIPSPKRLPEEHFPGDFPERSSLSSSGELSSKSTDESSSESVSSDILSPERISNEHLTGDFLEGSSLPQTGSSPLDIPSPKRLPIERFPGDFPKVYPLAQSGKIPLKRTDATTSGRSPLGIPSPKRLPEEHFSGDFPERSSLPQSGEFTLKSTDELSSKSTDESSSESFSPDIPSPKRLPEEHFSGDFPERSSLPQSGSSSLDIPSPKRLPIERFPGDFPKVYPLSQPEKLPLKSTDAATSGDAPREDIPSPKRLPDEHFPADFPERSSLSESKDSLPEFSEETKPNVDPSEGSPEHPLSPKRLPDEHTPGNLPNPNKEAATRTSTFTGTPSKLHPKEKHPKPTVGRKPLTKTSTVDSPVHSIPKPKRLPTDRYPGGFPIPISENYKKHPSMSRRALLDGKSTQKSKLSKKQKGGKQETSPHQLAQKTGKHAPKEFPEPRHLYIRKPMAIFPRPKPDRPSQHDSSPTHIPVDPLIPHLSSNVVVAPEAKDPVAPPKNHPKPSTTKAAQIAENVDTNKPLSEPSGDLHQDRSDETPELTFPVPRFLPEKRFPGDFPVPRPKSDPLYTAPSSSSRVSQKKYSTSRGSSQLQVTYTPGDIPKPVSIDKIISTLESAKSKAETGADGDGSAPFTNPDQSPIVKKVTYKSHRTESRKRKLTKRPNSNAAVVQDLGTNSTFSAFIDPIDKSEKSIHTETSGSALPNESATVSLSSDSNSLVETRNSSSVPQRRPIFISVPQHLPLNVTISRRKIRRHRKKIHRKHGKHGAEKILINGQNVEESSTLPVPATKGVWTRAPQKIESLEDQKAQSSFETGSVEASTGPSVDRFEHLEDAPLPSVETTTTWQYVTAPGERTASPAELAAQAEQDRLLTEEFQNAQFQNVADFESNRVQDVGPEKKTIDWNEAVAEFSVEKGRQTPLSEEKQYDAPSASPPDVEPPSNEEVKKILDKARSSAEPAVETSARAAWMPYQMDCEKEIDEKGALCKEWAESGLCSLHRPTMFLFCRKTCLCDGPSRR
ncbi:hypothetical protein Q1695_011383 [Nippostrongylus brasiliensis]|nr:hypothetical protein Q1695_011383 [Nippostrongylus brasiliensis]